MRAALICLSWISLAMTLPQDAAFSKNLKQIETFPRHTWLPDPVHSGASALSLAALRGGGAWSRSFSFSCAERNRTSTLRPSTFPNKRSRTPTPPAKPPMTKDPALFIHAVVMGDVDKVKRMLADGWSANSYDYDKRSALHLAAAFGQPEILLLLLSHGADPRARDRFDYVPHDDARRGNHVDCMQILEHSMHDYALWTKTHRAVNNLVGGLFGREKISKVSRITRIRERFAKMTSGRKGVVPPPSEDEEKLGKAMALCQAAASGDLEEVKRLIAQGTPVNTVDYDRRSALHLAAAEGQNEIIIYLLNNGADPRQRDQFRHLPFDDAKREDHDSSAEILMNAMSRGTLAGQAQVMYSYLLSRDSTFFSPTTWSDLLSGSLQKHAVAYDTDNCAKGQIIEYDPASLSVFGWFVNLKGTIFQVPVIYFQAIILLSITIVYSFICRQATPQDPNPLFPVFKGQAFGVGVVGGLLGFLLALFNANGLDRWWQTRMNLGRIIGKLNDFAILVATYVRNDEKKAECKEYRKTLVRWGNLVHILIYRQARNIHDISDLVQDTRYDPPRSWMTEEEWGILQGRLMLTEQNRDKQGIHKAFMWQQLLRSESIIPSESVLDATSPPAKSSPPGLDSRRGTPLFFAAQDLIPVRNKLVGRSTIVLYWIERLLSKLAREGLLEPSRFEALFKMQENLSEIRSAISTLFTYLYCKIPYIYVQLLTFMVKLYLLVIAVVAGSYLQVAKTPLDVLLALLLVVVSNFAYEGIMQIHVRLWNPLGFDTSAFPVSKYLEFVYKTTAQLLEDDQNILPENVRLEGKAGQSKSGFSSSTQPNPLVNSSAVSGQSRLHPTSAAEPNQNSQHQEPSA